MSPEPVLIYKCNPEENALCPKTSCQTECFWTVNKHYSLDDVPYVYDEKTQDFVPYEGKTK